MRVPDLKVSGGHVYVDAHGQHAKPHIRGLGSKRFVDVDFGRGPQPSCSPNPPKLRAHSVSANTQTGRWGSCAQNTPEPLSLSDESAFLNLGRSAEDTQRAVKQSYPAERAHKHGGRILREHLKTLPCWRATAVFPPSASRERLI